MVKSHHLAMLIVICLSLPAQAAKSLADAGKNTNEKQEASKKANSNLRVSVDKEAELKALGLVEVHLPEIKTMLDRLRASDPKEYARAIRDLSKSARKLDLARNRNERLFDLEVEMLKSQNQVNLLTAKLKVRDSPLDRKLLHAAAQRLQEAQVSRAQYDVEMQELRLERAEKMLESARQRLQAKQNQSSDQVEKIYTNMLRKAGRSSKEAGKKKK